MKDFLKLKHWQIFSILTIGYLLIGIFQMNDFNIGKVTSSEISIAITIIFIIIFFLWVLTIGLFLSEILDNPYKTKKWILIFAATCCILGYSDLNLQRLEIETISIWVRFVTTPLTFWGIIYVFYKIPKSLKSIELDREARFSEYILDIILFAIFPIGIWFIQPRVNRLYVIHKMIENETK